MKILSTTIDTIQTYWATLNLIFRQTEPHHSSPSRHLAIFAWALPPNSNAGVHRPLSFIKYGSKLGWKISAFHAPAPENQSQHGYALLRQVPDQVTLHSVLPSKLRPSYRLTPQVDGGYCNAIEMAQYAIAALATNPPDAVLASGPPFHTFIAARFVAKHYNVPLILDYRDEWTECPFDFVNKHSNDVTWERRCLRSAAAVLFTTQSHIDHQVRTFRDLNPNKVHLLPNGWDADDFDAAASLASPPVQTDGNFVLSHIGTLAGHNMPIEFLRSIENAFEIHPLLRERLRIRFIGRRSAEADKQLRGFIYQQNIEIVDHVDKAKANQFMMESDALLLISAAGLERYLPGKLFDYIASRRPIIVSGQPGESADIVKYLGVGLHVGKAIEFVEAFSSICEFNYTDSALVSSWLNEHRRDRLTSKLFSLIECLISEN